MTTSKLKITGARENNLKGITLELEHDTLTVLTGLSGSGKSSLAYGTVYAEGQRRYIETFSPYTRQFFDKVKKPQADLIEGVRPAIAIQQKNKVTNSRSTVGTMTNINDYLKTLWSNIATAICPTCGVPMSRWEAGTLAKHLLARVKAQGKTLLIGMPVILPEKITDRKNEIDRLVMLGYSRYYDPKLGTTGLLEESPEPALVGKNELLVILDRLTPDSTSEKRLRETLNQIFSGPGRAAIAIDTSQKSSNFLDAYKKARSASCQDHTITSESAVAEYRNSYICAVSGATIAPPKPVLFTFNHPLGACPTCRGFGNILAIDPLRCVPDPTLSIKAGALECLSVPAGKRQLQKIIKFCEAQDISITKPWSDLAESQKNLLFDHEGKDYSGIRAWFKRFERKLYKMQVRIFLSRYRTQFECPTCKGARLTPSALAYQVSGKTLSDLWEIPIADLIPWLISDQNARKERGDLVRQLKDLFDSVIVRLEFLESLGLGYLTLGRQSRTLSGGETQRVNLGAALGSDLISTHFVLDEPSVGLHPRDSAQLVRALRSLQEKGNSLLVVEHDPDCMAAADQIIELGPKAGNDGGKVVYSGPAQDWPGIVLKPRTANQTKPDFSKKLSIVRATARNLKNISFDIPLGYFVCLTGVSGSGKSTLVSEVIEKAFKLSEEKSQGSKSNENLVTGFDQLTQVLVVDQSSLAKSPRANIATYSGIWDTVRNLLASSEDAIRVGLSKSAFSFNVDGGRCPACKGAGFIKEDMQFLSDVYIQCEVCLGSRFQAKVLEVRYKGLNADQFLSMSIDDCLAFFAENKKIFELANTLSLLGLGHLRLGHPLSELSGGEAQRLKLVPFIEQSAKGTALLIFDEPTTGLHPHDVERLVDLLHLLRDRGHTVLCIEHNLQCVLASDWIIDLGPEAGAGGGEIVAQGTPAELSNPKKFPHSYTAQFLKLFVGGGSVVGRGKAQPASRKLLDQSQLTIRGAREHNLKNVDVAVPLDTIVALTGVSGSGKSSIAKDIIYAEGQRRYLDCLSPYARQFIKELKKPEIDGISNIKPTICVYQHTFQPSQLSTISSMSEINNFLRLLYAKIGTQFCPKHPEQAISPLSVTEIAEELCSIKADRVRILAPVIKQKKGIHRQIFERALAAEISEVRVDGVFARPGFFIEGLAKTKPHSIDFVVGSFNPKSAIKDLVQEAVTAALSLAGGTLVAVYGTTEKVFSLDRTCPVCKTGFFKLDPEDLSFHSKRGACKKCSGSGESSPGKSCPTCLGTRLSDVGRNVRFGGKNIFEINLLTCDELGDFLSEFKFSPREKEIATPIIQELKARIETLSNLGLDYLPLGRDCTTLSGGELQRLRLATAMGSPLTGSMYIFDEPSAGLHPLDNQRVLQRLKNLHQRGNSLLIIEHDSDSIRSCDYVIDVGPGGGKHGGEIVFSGPIAEFLNSAKTTTALELQSPISLSSGQTGGKAFKDLLKVTVHEKNNLKDLSVSIPLGALTTIAGVSGAGKSSLMHGVIVDAMEGIVGQRWSSAAGEITSSLPIERVLIVNQKPIGINSRSTPASYLGIWDEIRALFAMSVEAKSRGWGPNFFSYNTGKGRCQTCGGRGDVTLEMSFLPDAKTICEACSGRRFSEEANSISYLGLTISQALELTFEDAKSVFANHRKIHQPLRQACELGLGYLTLGQSSPTLSGGESQRIKLVAELGAQRRGHTLYVLDEPTTGLHRSDVARLAAVVKTLVQQGNSVIVIEHDADLIALADQVIELGPGPGAAGGKILFQGSPAELVKAKTPWGQILRKQLSHSDGQARQEIPARVSG